MDAKKAQDRTHLLQTTGQLKLLDEIDKLRSQGISHYVSLPQLIVCGDQSSGKSSVLEAISGITFPTKDNLCTRFATEVILRKASTVSISVHIIPSKVRTPAEEAHLKDFSETLQDLDQFSSVVDKAKEAMGISDTSGAFSNDVLRVEISGPDRPQLTIVDLPGLIHSENKVQSAADVTLVWDMVRTYMENDRSIILAVVSAKNDYANQAVLKVAKEVDAAGVRTLGVITKPDTLSVGSESEGGFVKLSLNEDIDFRLGWHVVRNRKYEERDVPTEVRNTNEAAFFSRGVWKELPRTMVGIEALRTRLSKVLLDHIRAELPALIDDIQSSLKGCEVKLDKLGSKRGTIGEQKSFLLHIGQAFQALAKASIDGAYDDLFFGDPRSDTGYAKRLRAVVQNLNLGFAETMRKRGHQRLIIEEPLPKGRYLLRPREKTITRTAFEAEILELLKFSRGRELPGMFNPMIVGEIFHQQAKPWESIARSHVQETYEAVKSFLTLALASLTDDSTLEGLLREVVEPLMQKRLTSVNKKLDEVLLSQIRGHPITYNHYFTENIQNMRQKRQEKLVIGRLNSVLGGDYSADTLKGDHTLQGLGAANLKMTDLVAAMSGHNEADMDKYACSEILLCMEAYYKVLSRQSLSFTDCDLTDMPKVAMKLLVDNVAVQAIEACLMTNLPDIISPASVVQMDDDTISRIAAEPEENQALREQLTRKLAVLKDGLQICNRYAGHRIAPRVSVPEISPQSYEQTGLGSINGDGSHSDELFQDSPTAADIGDVEPPVIDATVDEISDIPPEPSEAFWPPQAASNWVFEDGELVDKDQPRKSVGFFGKKGKNRKAGKKVSNIEEPEVIAKPSGLSGW